MSEIAYTITVDTNNETVTFLNDGSNIDAISVLSLYLRSEDKTSYIVNKTLNKTLFESTGVVYTYEDLFGQNPPPDDFYLCEIIGDEGAVSEMGSIKLSIGFTKEIATLIFNSTLGINIPIEDLFTSISIGMSNQILDFLQTLSTSATYTYDRENKWRKAYNYLTNVVNDLDY